MRRCLSGKTDATCHARSLHCIQSGTGARYSQRVHGCVLAVCVRAVRAGRVQHTARTRASRGARGNPRLRHRRHRDRRGGGGGGRHPRLSGSRKCDLCLAGRCAEKSARRDGRVQGCVRAGVSAGVARSAPEVRHARSRTCESGRAPTERLSVRGRCALRRRVGAEVLRRAPCRHGRGHHPRHCVCVRGHDHHRLDHPHISAGALT